MGTHCQTAAWSRSGERQNLGAVNYFWGKKGGQSEHDRNISLEVLSVFPLLYEIHGIPYIESCVEDLGSLL